MICVHEDKQLCSNCADAFAAERIAEVNEVADDLAAEMGVRTGTAERERDAAIALAEGRLRVLNEKAEELRHEWTRAEVLNMALLQIDYKDIACMCGSVEIARAALAKAAEPAAHEEERG